MQIYFQSDNKWPFEIGSILVQWSVLRRISPINSFAASDSITTPEAFVPQQTESPKIYSFVTALSHII